MTKTSDNIKYDSAGFDLSDAGENVILELGGVVTKEESEQPTKQQEEKKTVLSESEEWKSKGNEEFKAKNYETAVEYYSIAIEKCPSPSDTTSSNDGTDEGETIVSTSSLLSGQRILEMKEQHELKQREAAYKIHRRRDRDETQPSSDDDDGDDDENSPKEFQVPHHPHAKSLSIYHSNRAAALFYLKRYEECIQDCSISMLLNPSYIKPVIRRMSAYESTDKIEEALNDAKHALTIDSGNKVVKNHVNRLQKLEDERIEKLKEETIGKLKDLGNSFLGNFGLSLDNFQTVQDPNTGGYSISFNNNANK